MTGNHTILLVDDNLDDVEMTKIALEEAGRQEKLEVVSRGEAALSLLRKEDGLPSLILLDLKMPGMDGFETLRQIRRDDR